MKKNIDLLHEPILPALTKLALPIMATSLVQMAYNLTDMAWIGQVGAGALTAVGSAGMYTWLSQGVVALAKMGGQVKVAHSLGEGNVGEAANYAKGALQMGILFAVIYGLVSVAFADRLIGFFGLQSQEIVREAVVYLKITCGAILFSYLNAILTGILTATGDSRTPLLANVVGLAINIVLDPVLIFGVGPFPVMGVAGAAIATVLAQAVVTLVFLVAIQKDKVLFDKIHLFSKSKWRHIRAIIIIGFPAAVQNLIFTSISMILTRLVTSWGDMGVAVQRVGSQIESISWMTADGFAAAINSFTGQNYGGRQYDRVKRGYMTAVGLMLLWGAFSTALLVFLPGPIFGVFVHEPDIISNGVDYLTILGYSQLFMCIEITTAGALAGLGKTLLSSIISIVLTTARIPLAMILTSTGLGLTGIWWAITISSVLKGFLFFFCYLYTMKKLPGKEVSRL